MYKASLVFSTSHCIHTPIQKQKYVKLGIDMKKQNIHVMTFVFRSERNEKISDY